MSFPVSCRRRKRLDDSWLWGVLGIRHMVNGVGETRQQFSL